MPIPSRIWTPLGRLGSGTTSGNRQALFTRRVSTFVARIQDGRHGIFVLVLGSFSTQPASPSRHFAVGGRPGISLSISSTRWWMSHSRTSCFLLMLYVVLGRKMALGSFHGRSWGAFGLGPRLLAGGKV